MSASNVSDDDLEADHTDLTVPPNEGGREGPQVPFQDGMHVGQELLASPASTPGVMIDGADYGDQLGSKCSRSLQRTQHSPTSVSLPMLVEGFSTTGGETGPIGTSTGM